MIPHNPLAQHDSLSSMIYAAENQSWGWTRDLPSRVEKRRQLELALGLVTEKQEPVEETPAALEPDMDGHEDPHPLFCERELIAVHAEDAYRSEAAEDEDGDDDADTQSPVETDDEDEADLRDDDEEAA